MLFFLLFFSRSFHAYIRVIRVRYMAMVEERERRHTENLTLYVASIRSLILVNIAEKIADFLSSCRFMFLLLPFLMYMLCFDG